MRKILLLLLVCGFGFAQDGYKKVSKTTCECIEKKKLDLEKTSKEEVEMAFGLCMLSAYEEHSKLFKKEEKLDVNDEKSLEKFGARIAIEMFNDCPTFIGAMVKSEMSGENSEVKTEEADPIVEGKFISTKIDGVLYVSVKEESGKMNQFVLLNNFDNAYLIIDKVLKPNQKVSVAYFDTEIYDVKQNKLVGVKIISNLTKL